jgi:hypothetical protein
MAHPVSKMLEVSEFGDLPQRGSENSDIIPGTTLRYSLPSEKVGRYKIEGLPDYFAIDKFRGVLHTTL